ncbi:PASTA domain-containing protein [Jidongwangia harbinensis]|uniref:PASTA domain-containing protein n=1 Tax=Jidongwangia harbinensis TaxID=2878561 RepID=UPI001CD9AAC1|nr:PASTA domain-containing protein [Jidongwangia harbinensis]MCA2216653.1 PASTA domain-containing protein [Jidongwangia harbinensis]
MGRGRAKAQQTRTARLDTVVVPDLLGLTAPEAAGLGERAGLRVLGPDGDAASPAELQGPVVRQRPEPGVVTRRGSVVVVRTAGPGGDGGVREPRRPVPPTREDRAAADPA